MKRTPKVNAGDVPGPFVEAQLGDNGGAEITSTEGLEIPPNTSTSGVRKDLVCMKGTGGFHVVHNIPSGYRCPCGTALAEVNVPWGTAVVTSDRILPVEGDA